MEVIRNAEKEFCLIAISKVEHRMLKRIAKKEKSPNVPEVIRVIITEYLDKIKDERKTQ